MRSRSALSPSAQGPNPPEGRDPFCPLFTSLLTGLGAVMGPDGEGDGEGDGNGNGDGDGDGKGDGNGGGDGSGNGACARRVYEAVDRFAFARRGSGLAELKPGEAA